jgi:hypothetical protein
MYGTFAAVLLLMGVPNPATLAGVYIGELPAAGGPGRVFQLSLKLDGTATLRESCAGKGEITTAGKWSAADGKLTLTLSGAPITWKVGPGKLTPSEWDHQAWGSAGPPKLKKLTGVRHIPEKPIVK